MNNNLKQLLSVVALVSVCGVSFAQSGGGSVALTSNKNSFFGASSFSDVASLPGFSLSAPTGMVASWGVAYAGVSGISQAPFTSRADGAVSGGIGFGNARKTLGGSVDLGVGSINPTDGGAFNRGGVGLTVGRFFTDSLIGVAVGVKNATGWDSDFDTPDPSYYAAVTKILPNNYAPVIVNIGVGNNGYADINETVDRTGEIDVFGSVAVYVLPQVSLIADYTAGATSIGASLVPFAKLPLTLNVGVWDVLDNINGADTAVTGSLTYAFVF